MPIPKPGEDEPEDEFMNRCISFVMHEDPNTPQKQAVAMCGDQWRSRESYRSPDFQRIYGEFIKYYCKGPVACDQGVFEYRAWVKDLGLDETKPYARSLEAFRWAADMITKFKEDKENTYWKVPFAFPLKSMNNNVYTTEEIEAYIKTIIGKSPCLNHWEDTRSEFKAGGVVITAAKVEDGAGESILKVPNKFVCSRVGEGKTLNSLIAAKKIVNVSLELDLRKGEFDGYALLTADTLPGIPLARIKPLEAIMREALGSNKDELELSIEKFNKQVNDAIKRSTAQGKRVKLVFLGLGEPQAFEIFPDVKTVSVTSKNIKLTRPKPTCPRGSFWSDDYGLCVPDGVDPLEYADYIAQQLKYPIRPLPRHGDPAGFPAPKYTFVQQPNKGWRPRKPSPPDKEDPEYSEARCPPGFGYNPIHDLCVPNGVPVQDWLDYLVKKDELEKAESQGSA